MKKWVHCITFLSVIAFAGLITAEAFHSHQNAASESYCTLCQVANHMPALAHAPISHQPVVVSFRIPVIKVASARVQLVFSVSSRAPPAA